MQGVVWLVQADSTFPVEFNSQNFQRFGKFKISFQTVCMQIFMPTNLKETLTSTASECTSEFQLHHLKQYILNFHYWTKLITEDKQINKIILSSSLYQSNKLKETK